MLTALYIAIIISLVVAFVVRHKSYQRSLADLGTALGTAWNEAEKAHIRIQQLNQRDNVQAYEALEQGTNEIIENYENDRADLLEKIQRLEQEVADVQHQAAITLNELGDRIEFQHRSMSLYLQTIMDYEAGLEGGLKQYVELKPTTCTGAPCPDHSEMWSTNDGTRYCAQCGTVEATED